MQQLHIRSEFCKMDQGQMGNGLLLLCEAQIQVNQHQNILKTHWHYILKTSPRNAFDIKSETLPFPNWPKSLILAVSKPRCLLESYWRLFPSSKAFLLRLVTMVTVFLEWGTRNNTHCHYCLEKLEETRFICPIQCLSNRIWTNKRWLTCFASWNEAIANSSIFNFIFPIC